MSKDTQNSASRFLRLNQTLQREGIGGVSQWAYRWLYWNTPIGNLAKQAGKPLSAYALRNPIIVYQMGKVGSTTVYRSLKRMDLGVPLYHLHFLTDLDKMQRVSSTRRDADVANHNLEVARRIRQEMADHPSKAWDFVSLVRAPVPRLVSVFFQEIENEIPNAAARYQAGTLPLQQVLDYFIDCYRNGWAEKWFDKQLRAPFGLDVFAVPFERARGYQVYRHGNLKLLLIRLEDLNRVAADEMREFFGLPKFELQPQNVGEEKTVGTLYRDFRTALRLPDDFIKEINDSRYARHFYADKELEASVARWRVKA